MTKDTTSRSIPGITNAQVMDGVEEGETLNPAWPLGGEGLGDIAGLTTDVFTAEQEVTSKAPASQDANASVRVGEEEMA